MKKTILLIFSVFALVGCTLEEQLLSDAEPSTYYQTFVQCRTGLNGCYMPLKSLYSNGDYFEVCEVAADLIYHNSDSYYDAMCNYTQTEPRFGASIWNQGYSGVMRCNAVYAAIERSPLTDDEKATLLSECVILRAFYYYILTINFGDVPYYFEEITDANNDRIATLPRMSAYELREKLIEQLWYWIGPKQKDEKCRQALPYIKTYDPSNEYRIGAMVGLTIGGKLAMWNNRFDKALDFFQPIYDVYASKEAFVTDPITGSVTNTPSDALLGYPLKDVMFRNRYTAESILELPGYAKDFGFKVTQTLASRCTPMRTSNVVEGADDDMSMDDEEGANYEQQDDYYNGIRIPELGINARTTSPYRTTYYFHKVLMPYNANDRRRSVYNTSKAASNIEELIEDGGGWLAWCHKGCKYEHEDPEKDAKVYFFNGVGDYNGVPYLGDKFWCPGMVYTQDSNNLKIFRFAHVLLDMAESHLRVGNYDEAAQFLNASKKRAGRDDLKSGADAADEAQFMIALQEESARELFGEFTRRHNLVRWGIWEDQILNHAKTGKADSKTQADCDIVSFVREAPCRKYYPIPDQQIVLSNYNLDNKEYNKYGM